MSREFLKNSTLHRKAVQAELQAAQTHYEIHHADAFDWLTERPDNTIHGVVSDPPFGIVEFNPDQLKKRRDGNGGVWRLPAAFDGAKRAPTPRFTVLSKAQISELCDFFRSLALALNRVLVPGAHVFLSSHVTLTHHLGDAFEQAEFERRGIVARTVRTFRGGDRPKGAHREFNDTSVIPRAAWEPWLLFRKPLEGRIQDNLRKWKTGALRRPIVIGLLKILSSQGGPPALSGKSLLTRHSSRKSSCGSLFAQRCL